MQALGILYQKRGLGCFVAADAREIILEDLRKEFFATTMPNFIREMRMLGVSKEEIMEWLAREM